MQIKEITLSGLLPRVFSREELAFSEVWRSQLRLHRGGRYLVESASGGGKSSLASFIMGARTDYEGKILFDDTDISTLKTAEWQELRRENLAYLPQDLGLFPELSAFDNIRLKIEISGFSDIQKAEEWMERLGVDNRRDFPAGKLSVGQQQRVALIRTLCQNFDFILLDEPVSHLDEANNRIAAAIVEEEASRQEAGVVVFSVGNPLLIDNTERLIL